MIRDLQAAPKSNTIMTTNSTRHYAEYAGDEVASAYTRCPMAYASLSRRISESLPIYKLRESRRAEREKERESDRITISIVSLHRRKKIKHSVRVFDLLIEGFYRKNLLFER